MPLYKTMVLAPHTTIAIWKITESFDCLMRSLVLTSKSVVRVLGMKSDTHQRGFLSVRHLLKVFGYADADLFYDSNGKPFLKEGKHISVTHSFHFAAVMVSDRPCGIDIEKQRSTIRRIAHKFIDYEIDSLHGTAISSIKTLTTLWCIKESLYKLFATSGLSFKDHCFVIPFSDSDTKTTAWIDYNGKKYRYRADFIDCEGFVCVCTVPN